MTELGVRWCMTILEGLVQHGVWFATYWRAKQKEGKGFSAFVDYYLDSWTPKHNEENKEHKFPLFHSAGIIPFFLGPGDDSKEEERTSSLFCRGNPFGVCHGTRLRDDDQIGVWLLLSLRFLRLRNTDEARNNNEGIHVWIEHFNKLKPLSFKSAATPTEAEDWISHCEKMFQVVGCPDGVKTRLATFKLEGDALNWWKAHAVFHKTFYKRYIPFSEQQRYEREYGLIHQLERENSAEYIERFHRLASFVGPTVTGDAQRQARHYKWGLKHWVLDHIVNTEYDDVSMNRGSDHRDRSEQSFDHRSRSDRQYEHRGQFNRGHDQGVQNRYSGSGSSHQQYHSGNSSGHQKRAEILPPPPTCPSCGKAHSGTCHRVSGACFECGSLDHKVKFCPKVTSIVPACSSQPSSSSGRVYSFTCEQADKASGHFDGESYYRQYSCCP
ncbi:reverse transcriptase domain-containing protein [Artemisia annua]|uniref:Reverse transcriptase domain-containing protein n=1 Tax=Artemisia annua TaxID=35608 RepID=A0A2U1LG79_ARTAN|nr:reverse transcriptase domain-containing protein [Artemisia annua]